MGLPNLKWIRGADESRNGFGDSKTDRAAALGQAVLELIGAVVDEMQRRWREDDAGSHDAAETETEKTTKEK